MKINDVFENNFPTNMRFHRRGIESNSNINTYIDQYYNTKVDSDYFDNNFYIRIREGATKIGK